MNEALWALGRGTGVVALVVLVGWLADRHDQRIIQAQRHAAIRLAQQRAELRLYEMTHNAMQSMLNAARRRD